MQTKPQICQCCSFHSTSFENEKTLYDQPGIDHVRDTRMKSNKCFDFDITSVWHSLCMQCTCYASSIYQFGNNWEHIY